MTLAEELLREIRREFPAFRVVPKSSSPLHRAIDVALRLLTFGGQHSYLSRYHTVLGATLYVPEGWDQRSDDDRYVLLRHERVHLRQFRRYGRVGMALLYLLPFFPLGLAWSRARLEWEAYEESLRATAKVGGLPAARALRAHIVRQFTGPAYGWMWPFPRSVERWIDVVLEELGRGE